MMGTSLCFTDIGSQLLKCNWHQMTEMVLLLPVMLKERPNMSPHGFQLLFFFFITRFLSLAVLQSYVRAKQFPLGLMEGSS